MLNILADALLIATGNRPQSLGQNRNRDIHWNDRFQARPSQDADRTNPKRDPKW
jgi:hypothetical protein